MRIWARHRSRTPELFRTVVSSSFSSTGLSSLAALLHQDSGGLGQVAACHAMTLSWRG